MIDQFPVTTSRLIEAMLNDTPDEFTVEVETPDSLETYRFNDSVKAAEFFLAECAEACKANNFDAEHRVAITVPKHYWSKRTGYTHTTVVVCEGECKSFLTKTIAEPEAINT